MTAKELLTATKNSSWRNATAIIQNSGLEINLIQNLPFCKMWEVKNNREISHVSNTVIHTRTGFTADVKFCFNE